MIFPKTSSSSARFRELKVHERALRISLPERDSRIFYAINSRPKARRRRLGKLKFARINAMTRNLSIQYEICRENTRPLDSARPYTRTSSGARATYARRSEARNTWLLGVKLFKKLHAIRRYSRKVLDRRTEGAKLHKTQIAISRSKRGRDREVSFVDVLFERGILLSLPAV